MMHRWHRLYEKIFPHIVSIETKQTCGTGFLVYYYSGDGDVAAFATAAHVIQDAQKRKDPITLRHCASGQQVSFKEQNRLVQVDLHRDSATIAIRNRFRELPTRPLEMIAPGRSKKIGVEVGLIGFPWGSPKPSLLHGFVSSRASKGDYYLVDGVVINGMSGGLAFAGLNGDTPQVVGIISAYRPNRIKAAVHLPGLARIQGLTSLHSQIATLKLLEEAIEKKRHAA